MVIYNEIYKYHFFINVAKILCIMISGLRILLA